jgi:hypothetical protein
MLLRTGGIWKETVSGYCKIISWHLSEVPEGNYRHSISGWVVFGSRIEPRISDGVKTYVKSIVK